MTTISLRLPDTLHRKVRDLARKDGISINQAITVALAEKISALFTAEYLEGRARRATKAKFRRAMGKAPDAPPPAEDAF